MDDAGKSGSPEHPAAHAARPLEGGLVFGGTAAACFALAALSWPGGGYNPFLRMLSALGRTVVKGVERPLCRYLFMAGMFCSAIAVVAVFLPDARRLSGWRSRAARLGLAANAAGLVAIALFAENANQFLHSAGCWIATLGGGAILLARDRRGRDRVWTVALAVVAAAFGAAIGLHAAHAAPFVPWVPSLQKAVILSFSLWALDCARRASGGGRVRRRVWCLLTALAVVVTARAVIGATAGPLRTMRDADAAASTPEPAREYDEAALDEALAWLEHVTGPLSPEEEREWWDIGGSQHGLYAKRYHIAFCGYAAAAVATHGLLGSGGGGDDASKVSGGARAAERHAAAGRILAHCINRYIRREIWAYSMSRSYWGLKPWAPDPCHRENAMYTGHLLHLLALYESFTGDTRYWTDGWDFTWHDGRCVHYTVQKLIDTTVEQMRCGPNGGVCCEPGLMFFPCNNHFHVAFKIFAALGHGDWSADARRWERWALPHYFRPVFGGGAVKMVWHARSNIAYPRGQNALDGWSLLWYAPWASDRALLRTLWREAAARIDWDALESGEDAPPGSPGCLDPAPMSPFVTATFQAAAARACGDAVTAGRLDAIADRRLVRRDGLLWLDLDRDWRIGATANRIVSLAL